MSLRKKGAPTGLNLWVLKRFFGGELVRPNAMDATDAPHLRRCLKAGLCAVEGDSLTLTAEGREAVRGVS